MAKVSKAYGGNSSYGVPVEVAQSVSGAWFSREYSFNGYARTWSKWQRMQKAPTHPETWTNVYTLEESKIENPEMFLNWGFQRLEKYSITPKYRLPE